MLLEFAFTVNELDEKERAATAVLIYTGVDWIKFGKEKLKV